MNWYGANDPRAYVGTTEEIQKYNIALRERQQTSPYEREIKHSDIVNEIEENGVAILRQAINTEQILRLKAETEKLLEKPENLKFNDTHLQMIRQPLMATSLGFELATHDIVAEIACEYFKCIPSLGTFNLKRSLVSNLPPKDAQLYHCDSNSIKILKFFFYLTDVDMDGAPFTYIKGSHKEKFSGWNRKYRWEPKEIEEIYGQERVLHATGKVGDLVMANTTGFHRGYPPVSSERLMLTVNYVIHPEYWKPITFKVRRPDHNRLPNWKKPLTDFVIKE